jgi:hypothetical protein
MLGEGVDRGAQPGRWTALLLGLSYAVTGFAAHPLITEDTGTQGRGNGQLELTAEYGREDAADTRDRSGDFAAVLAYGLLDTLDLMLTLPYAHNERRADGAIFTSQGFGAVGLEAKWRFLEWGGLSMALKAGAFFPSGDAADGLGAGKANFSANLMTSYETGPWGYHLHLAYFGNRNVHDERDAIRHASFALTYLAMENFRLVADLGNFTAPDRIYDEDARFLTLGGIYGVNEDFDIDLGLRHGLTEPETDTTLLVGIALRF